MAGDVNKVQQPTPMMFASAGVIGGMGAERPRLRRKPSRIITSIRCRSQQQSTTRDQAGGIPAGIRIQSKRLYIYDGMQYRGYQNNGFRICATTSNTVRNPIPTSGSCANSPTASRIISESPCRRPRPILSSGSGWTGRIHRRKPDRTHSKRRNSARFTGNAFDITGEGARRNFNRTCGRAFPR